MNYSNKMTLEIFKIYLSEGIEALLPLMKKDDLKFLYTRVLEKECNYTDTTTKLINEMKGKVRLVDLHFFGYEDWYVQQMKESADDGYCWLGDILIIGNNDCSYNEIFNVDHEIVGFEGI